MSIDDSRLSIIIPTWNGQDLLRRCLQSLQRQTKPAEILVIDNGSVDGTDEMLTSEFPNVHLHRFPSNQGFAKAVNQGILLARTPCIALLNNDTEADPGWVEAGLEAFQAHPEFDFFACRLVNFHDRERLDSAGDCYNRRGMPYKRGWGEPVASFGRPEPVLGASAGAAFYRRSLFHQVGLFDEDIHIYLEDVEFSLRCQLLGHRCLYLPQALVYHLEAASDPDRASEQGAVSNSQAISIYYSANRVFWISRNRWLLMCLYQPWRNLPFLVYGWVRSGLFHLLKAGFFWSFARGVASGLVWTPRFLGKRMRLRHRRQLSIRDLCQLFREC